MSANSGEGLGRYRIDGELGRGAMGVVYQAWDTTLDRAVALKELVLQGGAAGIDEELVARFLREARAAARLAHQNVVQVYDVFSDGGRYFIAMEMLDGVQLTELISSQALSQQSATQLVIQILDAVQAAHDAGIVHRDLKPDNIFVLGDGRVKVTDFGIAKLADNSSHHTQAGTVMGTPGYMAPEQLLGSGVDARADIFSVGVIAYELYSGGNPFIGPSTTATMYNIANAPTPAMNVASLPPSVEAVVVKALAKDVTQRYQAAREMSDDLRLNRVPQIGSVGTDSTHSVPTFTAAGPSRPISGGLRTGLVAAAVVAGLAVLGFAFVTLGGGGGGGATAPVAAEPVSEVATPAIDIASPTTPSDAIAGQPIDITLDMGAGEMGIDSVRLLVNGTPVGQVLAEAPWQWSWTPPSAEPYELAVLVKSDDGSEITGPSTTLFVSEAAVPEQEPTLVSGPSADGFWTAMFISSKSESDARAKATKVQAAGFDADVLFSSEWENLNPGWWAGYSGQFTSKAQADARASELKASGFDAYPRQTGAGVGD